MNIEISKIMFFFSGKKEERNYDSGVLAGRVTRYTFSKIAKNCRKTPKSKNTPKIVKKWPKYVKNMIKVAKKYGHFSQKRPKFGEKLPHLVTLLAGPAIIYGVDGDKFEFNYVEGSIEGQAIYYAANGASEERTYVSGI